MASDGREFRHSTATLGEIHFLLPKELMRCPPTGTTKADDPRSYLPASDSWIRALRDSGHVTHDLAIHQVDDVLRDISGVVGDALLRERDSCQGRWVNLDVEVQRERA